MTELREHLHVALGQAILNDELARQAKWTQAIAVGERAFIEAIADQIQSRRHMAASEEGGSLVLREEHEAVYADEKRAVDPFGGAFLP